MCRAAPFFLGSVMGLRPLCRAFAYEPRIALIIDDIGFSRSRAREFIELALPMTFSILPRLSRSEELAREIHHEGREIMLHQPMEPRNPDLNPGPGALFVGNGEDRILRVMEENISAVPYAVGVNNHMGSRFTATHPEIRKALEVLKTRNLLFVDSLTTSSSMAYETARDLRLPAGYRNVFLDNHPGEPAILCQLRKLKRIALRHGHAIGIGHPHPETARAIGRFSHDLERSGISLVHVSRLIHTA